jgi:glutamine cyclotransferase
VYSVDSFKKEREFTYPTEGWGLAFDGTYLIMSNGSEYLTYLDTANYTIVKRIQVYDNNGPITKLNELECVNGYVYSNVYTTNFIVKIDPATGKVVERWELNNLLSDTDKTERTDVLNGIAYNSRNNHFFITGKYWPKLFEMKLY